MSNQMILKLRVSLLCFAAIGVVLFNVSISEAKVDRSSAQSIPNGNYDCSALPCTFIDIEGRKISITGDFKTSGMTASYSTEVSMDGAYFGEVFADILMKDGQVNYKGVVRRSEINSANLMGLILPFDVTVNSGLKEGDALPVLDIHTVIDHSVLLTFMNVEAMAGVDSLECSDERRDEPLGCNGPMFGLPLLPAPIPLPFPNLSDAMEECCIKHDICFMNGGDPACERACDREFQKCANAAAPFWSKPYTATLMAIMVSTSSSYFNSNNDPCRCLFDLSPFQIDLIQSTSYSSTVTEQGVCCAMGKNCRQEACWIRFLDHTGWPVLGIAGTCHPPIKPGNKPDDCDDGSDG